MTEKKVKKLDSHEFARQIASAIEDNKGTDIRILDLRGLSDIADWFGYRQRYEPETPSLA